MNRTITAVLTVLALAATAAPAHADATVKEGKVSLSVKGHGLTVRRVGGWIDSLGTGVRVRLYIVDHGERRRFGRAVPPFPFEIHRTQGPRLLLKPAERRCRRK